MLKYGIRLKPTLCTSDKSVSTLDRSVITSPIYKTNKLFPQRMIQSPLSSTKSASSIKPTYKHVSSDEVHELQKSNLEYLIEQEECQKEIVPPRNPIKSKLRINTDQVLKQTLNQILGRRDRRTTIQINHIPSKYNSTALIEELNEEFKGKYNMLCLPLEENGSGNLGFAIINFIDPMHIPYFFHVYTSKKWRSCEDEVVSKNLFTSGLSGIIRRTPRERRHSRFY